MGGGASAPTSPVHRPKIDPFEALFINESVRRAESQLVAEPLLRAVFIEFIKNGRWIDKFAVFEELEPTCKTESSTVWEKHGYICPPKRRDDTSSKFSLKSSASFQTLGTIISDVSGRSSVQDSLKSGIGGQAVPHWSLCATAEDVRAIMLVLLCPLFFASREYKHYASPHLPNDYSSSSGSTKQGHDDASERSMHLREMMLSAAAAFDSAELEAHLSWPQPRLVADFKKALANLPLRMSVLEVDQMSGATSQNSLFEFSGKLTLSFRSARSLRDIVSLETSLSPAMSSDRFIFGGGSALNRDLTPEQRQQVDTALADCARLKLAVTTSYDRCALHAWRPVCDPAGQVKYMLTVETLNRVCISKAGEGRGGAREFEQMDDLLLLLPALMRTE